MNKLKWLNSGNPTGMIQMIILENLLEKFPNEKLTGLEIGCAYGGGVEISANIWKDRGDYYGYDTFEGHPRDLAKSPDDLEAWCMDMWYQDPNFGTEALDIEYQRERLKDLPNAFLVKGRVNEHSFDDIEKIHFAIIDLDMIKPTKVSFEAIKNKVVTGGYVIMHDSLPPDHLPELYKYVYEEIIPTGKWKIIKESFGGLCTVLEKWKNIYGDLNGQLLDMNSRGNL